MNDQDLSFICAINLEIKNRYQLASGLIPHPLLAVMLWEMCQDEKRAGLFDSGFETFKILIDWNVFSTTGFCGEQF